MHQDWARNEPARNLLAHKTARPGSDLPDAAGSSSMQPSWSADLVSAPGGLCVHGFPRTGCCSSARTGFCLGADPIR